MHRLILFIFLGLFSAAQSQELSICSWNLKDFGSAKNETEIYFIANTIKAFDVVAIQEVVASAGGEEAVARLHEALEMLGDSWEYTISEATSSSAYKTERYAFLWKNKRLEKVGDAWLEIKYTLEIDREPYFITFKVKDKKFTLVSFHAITKSKQPETEIKYFKFMPAEYPGLQLIFCGDFNLPQSHSVFNPLKEQGFSPALVGQKTSLRDRCLDDGCLANEYDNFFLQATRFELLDKGVVHFYKSFPDLESARKISDHIPVYVKIRMR
jgi:deoxyribonuclease-1-like protein